MGVLLIPFFGTDLSSVRKSGPGILLSVVLEFTREFPAHLRVLGLMFGKWSTLPVFWSVMKDPRRLNETNVSIELGPLSRPSPDGVA